MKNFPELLEARLISACDAPGGSYSACAQAAIEHFAAGGSRIRARICFDAGIRLGLSENDALVAATVCELLHNASLIQDDLLDRTTLRRGRPCVWVEHGDTIAVCTGDLMLSSAYGLLCELGQPTIMPSALRLVHQRTTEVILGQAAESSAQEAGTEGTLARYERLAKAKSASLLSLSLELPLLLSGHENWLTIAHEATSDFAVAYQIADDLADVLQDMQEGTLNLALLLMQYEDMTRADAVDEASRFAGLKLSAAKARACLLPNGCAAGLLHHADRLRHSLDAPAIQALSTAESPA
jgi:geranylgeranyl diphosphate synthase type II